jgi:hypothetical protein
VLAKVGKAKVGELDLNDLVLLAADYKAIENGDAHASELFELKEAKPAGAADLKSKLKAQVEQAPKAEVKPELRSSEGLRRFGEASSSASSEGAMQPKPTDVIVKPGKQPFSYYTADQKGEYLTSVDGDRKSCNCGHKPDGACVHVAAVEAYIKG